MLRLMIARLNRTPQPRSSTSRSPRSRSPREFTTSVMRVVPVFSGPHACTSGAFRWNSSGMTIGRFMWPTWWHTTVDVATLLRTGLVNTMPVPVRGPGGIRWRQAGTSRGSPGYEMPGDPRSPQGAWGPMARSRLGFRVGVDEPGGRAAHGAAVAETDPYAEEVLSRREGATGQRAPERHAAAR